MCIGHNRKSTNIPELSTVKVGVIGEEKHGSLEAVNSL